MTMSNNTKLLARVERILDIARGMADKKDKELGTYSVGNYISDIRVYTEYCEPGYDSPNGVIVLGNWNTITKYDRVMGSQTISDLPKRLANIFEKMGVDVEWSDEWSDCSDCG